MTHPKTIGFTKATACGNDFLIVDGSGFSVEMAELSRRMCDRHRGVGADGVEWLFPDADCDVSARLFNADGSEAEVSGNGTRCVAAYWCTNQPKERCIIRTGAGLKTCLLTARSGNTFEFEADMGEPVVEPEVTIAADGVCATGRKVSMGNPHFVILAEEFQTGWQEQAARIAAQPIFPEGTNVEFVAVRHSRAIDIRLFERGVGETQSSGTGSCASAVASIASGRTTSPVEVMAPGGSQTVRWDHSVYLRGPASLICRGEFFI